MQVKKGPIMSNSRSPPLWDFATKPFGSSELDVEIIEGLEGFQMVSALFAPYIPYVIFTSCGSLKQVITGPWFMMVHWWSMLGSLIIRNLRIGPGVRYRILRLALRKHMNIVHNSEICEMWCRAMKMRCHVISIHLIISVKFCWLLLLSVFPWAECAAAAWEAPFCALYQLLSVSAVRVLFWSVCFEMSTLEASAMAKHSAVTAEGSRRVRCSLSVHMCSLYIYMTDWRILAPDQPCYWGPHCAMMPLVWLMSHAEHSTNIIWSCLIDVTGQSCAKAVLFGLLGLIMYTCVYILYIYTIYIYIWY